MTSTRNAHLNKQIVKRHFDRHARHYDAYTELQRQMSRKLADGIRSRMAPLAEKRKLRVLEIGSGTGHATEFMLRQFPDAAITAIELSPQMIAIAREKLENGSKVEFIEGDAEEVWPSLQQRPTYDLIFSNAVFQWFAEPANTVRGFLGLLADHGCMAFSTFGAQTFRELRRAFCEAEKAIGLPVNEHGPSMLSSGEWKAVFAGGRGRLDMVEHIVESRYPSVREFMLAVKRMGASNAVQSGNAGLSGRRLLQAMETYYQRHYSNSDGIAATYHLLFGYYQRAGGFDIMNESGMSERIFAGTDK